MGSRQFIDCGQNQKLHDLWCGVENDIDMVYTYVQTHFYISQKSGYQSPCYAKATFTKKI